MSPVSNSFQHNSDPNQAKVKRASILFHWVRRWVDVGLRNQRQVGDKATSLKQFSPPSEAPKMRQGDDQIIKWLTKKLTQFCGNFKSFVNPFVVAPCRGLKEFRGCHHHLILRLLLFRIPFRFVAPFPSILDITLSWMHFCAFINMPRKGRKSFRPRDISHTEWIAEIVWESAD